MNEGNVYYMRCGHVHSRMRRGQHLDSESLHYSIEFRSLHSSCGGSSEVGVLHSFVGGSSGCMSFAGDRACLHGQQVEKLEESQDDHECFQRFLRERYESMPLDDPAQMRYAMVQRVFTTAVRTLMIASCVLGKVCELTSLLLRP